VATGGADMMLACRYRLFRHPSSIDRAARNAPPIRRCELHTMQDDEAEKPKPCGGNRRMHLPR